MSKVSAHNRRVVIIEDDPVFANTLTNILASLGYDVVVRLDSSASETYEIRDSDVVFLDLLMPQVSGVQVLDRLNRQNLPSPIVLMSGNENYLRIAEEVMKQNRLQLLGVLHKPFLRVDVQAVLEGL